MIARQFDSRMTWSIRGLFVRGIVRMWKPTPSHFRSRGTLLRIRCLPHCQRILPYHTEDSREFRSASSVQAPRSAVAHCGKETRLEPPKARTSAVRQRLDIERYEKVVSLACPPFPNGPVWLTRAAVAPGNFQAAFERAQYYVNAAQTTLHTSVAEVHSYRLLEFPSQGCGVS